MIYSTRLPALLLVCCLLPTMLSSKSVHADQAILIGGGYNVNGSQGQIELNVQWVQDVLKKAELSVTTFFTDGDDPGPDVHYVYDQSENSETSTIDELALQLEPVARLFGNQMANQRRYRNHNIKDVQGGTHADVLANTLKNMMVQKPDTPNLIVFNGHGRQSETSADKVTMELWNDTAMTATQLHSILNLSKAQNRFVFTQCYSGGFHRVAYENPEKGLKLSETTRCGFTAESAYRLAEGCSASVDTADYRDYTTYFFAALNGEDRNGILLPEDTDKNGDGEVSMREAHFYTLANAHSTDLSRSTSEDYLTTWQPWFLKWVAESPGLHNNEYAKLFRTVATRHNIALNGNPAKEIRANMRTHTDARKRLLEERDKIQTALASIQNELIYEAQAKWPSLARPYTALFQSMASTGEMIQIANWVREHGDYQAVVDLQNQDDGITQSLLETERNLTQMQKMLHFRNIAKLKHQIYEYGTTTEISDYEKLVSCEDTPLVTPEPPLVTSEKP